MTLYEISKAIKYNKEVSIRSNTEYYRSYNAYKEGRATAGRYAAAVKTHHFEIMALHGELEVEMVIVELLDLEYQIHIYVTTDDIVTIKQSQEETERILTTFKEEE